MATAEGFVFDGLALNDFTNFRIQEFDPGIPPKRWQWISGDDADGAVLPEEAHFDNAEMTLRIRIMPQASMDAALAKIGQIVDKLQECEQQPLGLAAVWTPAGSTKTLTAYVLGGEVSGIPITTSGDDQGWFLKNPAPVVNLKLYRRPFLYGTEVTSAASLTDANPAQILTVAGVTGDVPAEARLVVTDAATQSRRHIEWGLEWRYYNAATSLILDSDNLVTTGFAGAGTTRAGAYDPGAAGNSVIRATLVSQEVAVCGTGNLGHVGVFRVRARVYATATTNLRFSWQEGDGAFRANGTVQTATTGWNDVDLGIINLPPKLLGTQKWSGRILAAIATTSTPSTVNFLFGVVGTDTIDVDYIMLVPAGEGYAKARGTYAYGPGAVIARDEFTGIAATTALNARVAPLGGTWATSGAATDFVAADAPISTDETEVRSTTSEAAGGRYAILGATNYTDVEVGVSFYTTSLTLTPGAITQAVVARWTDASNHLRAYFRPDAVGGTPGLYLVKVVAGVSTQIAVQPRAISPNIWYAIRLVVFASGTGDVALLGADGQTLLEASFVDSALATGGTLATGKPGFQDANTGAFAATRYYDKFYVATPAAEPIVVYSGRAAEFRSDASQRQDSTGTYYGEVPSVRGAHFYLSPAGDEARTSRILVKARRNDIDAAVDDQIADSTTVTVHYTPRYSTVPR